MAQLKVEWQKLQKLGQALEQIGERMDGMDIATLAKVELLQMDNSSEKLAECCDRLRQYIKTDMLFNDFGPQLKALGKSAEMAADLYARTERRICDASRPDQK